MNRQISLQSIVEFIGDIIIEVKGSIDNIAVSNIKATDEVDENSLDWINPLKQNKQDIAEQSKAKVILCDTSVLDSKNIVLQGKILIHVKNPKLVLALIADKFFKLKQEVGIHPSASIHHEAVISPTVFIGANCSIGKCKIGNGSQIFPNVTIYDDVTIGNNVVIHAGAVIGTDGLGCERREDGRLIKFPHLGGVLIGDDVEIGANCQIAKGALANTIIGDGTKINGLCFISHNCILGKNVWISASSTIAGSSHIEDNVTIFSKVMIREQRIIGKGATIGMGSVVTKNVPPGETWIGSPAKIFEKKF